MEFVNPEKYSEICFMHVRILIYLILMTIVCSCHPKIVAVSDVDDIYYKEITSHNTAQESKSKSKTKSKSNNKPKTKPASPSKPKSEIVKNYTGDLRALIYEAYSWVGTPYVYGGHSLAGTDCSGYVMEVFRRALDFSFPRSTTEQSEACNNIRRKDLQPGDLVFFHNLRHGAVSHVGIYIGDGRFLHASTSRGVMESSLDEEYFDRRFSHGGHPKGLTLK